MTRAAKAVTDMEIDEISLVDRPANQHAAVVIAKRATQEDAVPEDFEQPEAIYDADGKELNFEALQPGDVVYDTAGNAYEFELVDEQQDERELATVGKSSAFLSEPVTPVEQLSKSLAQTVQEELSKAITEADQVAVLSKAFAAAETRSAQAEQRVGQLEQVAKSERELRLKREYIAKAAEYNVPIPADDLGPVLMRMAESMSYDDCSVIHKALTSSGALLAEVGFSGEADNADPLAEIQTRLDSEVAKNAGEPVSKAQALTAFFDDNPDAYERYRAERAR